MILKVKSPPGATPTGLSILSTGEAGNGGNAPRAYRTSRHSATRLTS